MTEDKMDDCEADRDGRSPPDRMFLELESEDIYLRPPKGKYVTYSRISSSETQEQLVERIRQLARCPLHWQITVGECEAEGKPASCGLCEAIRGLPSQAPFSRP